MPDQDTKVTQVVVLGGVDKVAEPDQRAPRNPVEAGNTLVILRVLRG